MRFEVERITIEPFDLKQPANYDVVLDRLTYWYDVSREWIKKAVIMDGVYVLNNPWSVQSNEKHTSLLRHDAARHAGAEDRADSAEGVRREPGPPGDAARYAKSVRSGRGRRGHRATRCS